MSSFVFIERSRLGKVFYEVKDDHLRVSGRRALEAFAVEVEFHAMSPRIERLSRRFYRPIVISLGLGSLAGALTGALVLQKKVDFGAVFYFAEVTGILAAVFLATGIRWLPCLEVARFKDAVGRTVFDAVKEKAYADEFEEFIEQLRDRIMKSKEPNQSSEPTAPSGRGSP